MLFLDFNNDILIKIMTYLPVNYLISINKQLLSLHNEYYYRLFLEKDHPKKVSNVYRNTYKKLIDYDKLKTFEFLLYKVNMEEDEDSNEDNLIIYIMENMSWERISYHQYKTKNKIGKFSFNLVQDRHSGYGMMFHYIEICWKNIHMSRFAGVNVQNLTNIMRIHVRK